ncbi:MAG TPA: dihydrolipoamide acetyltransferase family protein [Bryobacteraceae bacterium]|jgi:2-oxoglutarate dehydrogenase E2 component (dihydrolipoamide succinyltransferase)|nr:dihydrolipoamide acetyltransferase family protein [Bryobacteraceae bacterium]
MIDVVMPQMGESIVEGTLTRWLKQPGEKVERDEPLFEISTDKVDTEIPSPAAGTLSEILVQEGTTVAINSVVARIGDGASGGQSSAPVAAPAAAPEQQQARPSISTPSSVDVGPSAASREARVNGPSQPSAAQPQGSPQASPAAQAAVSQRPPEPQPAAAGPYPIEPPAREAQTSGSAAAPPTATRQPDGDGDTGPLSPLVRKMAREYNIDLAQVKGTGAGGRITKQDVEAFMSSQAARTYAAPAGPAQPSATAQSPGAQQTAAAPQPAAPQRQTGPATAALPLAESAKTRTEPMSTMRQKIAEHMVMSKRTSAHVTTVHRVDMTKIAKLRDASKAEFQARNGFSLTFLPFVTAAAGEALRAFPLFNASIDGKNIVYYRDINIGIAVALEGGLIVPVIRNADEKNVAGLQRAIVDLATRARSRQLKPDEVQGGTFSITNFGSFGSIFATPVINQPQVAILGLGAVEKIPAVVDGDAIAIRSQAHLALTFDHRLIDGALGDQFCQKVKSILENWSANIL